MARLSQRISTGGGNTETEILHKGEAIAIYN
jgi:hypothetical protein